MGRVSDFFHDNNVPLDGQKRTKMVALDRQCEDIESERDRLKTENLHLQAKVNPLERENERLQQQLQEKASPSLSLDQTKEEMLRVLNKHPDSPTVDMAKTFDMTKEGVKFHLDLMKKAGLVDSYYDDGETWHLEHGGRAYLHKKGWLK